MKSKHKGSMLIEALIAMFIFTVGILGLIALQGKLQAFAVESKFYLSAAALASEMSGMAVADPENVGCYQIPLGTCGNATAQTFNTNWQTLVTNQLPNATMTAAYDASNRRYTLTINWRREHESSSHVFKMITQMEM